MLATEQKIRRGFQWVAVILAACLLAIGLVLTTFDVGDLWHADGEDIPPTSIGALILGVVGLLVACVAVWGAVRALGWVVVRIYRRYENQQQLDRTTQCCNPLTGRSARLKMLIVLEGAHAFCVSIFGGVEHLRADVQTTRERN
ncbi:MAG: hypothetical protein ACREXY_15650 [Gammaproteobacteria bacterium]